MHINPAPPTCVKRRAENVPETPTATGDEVERVTFRARVVPVRRVSHPLWMFPRGKSSNADSPNDCRLFAHHATEQASVSEHVLNSVARKR